MRGATQRLKRLAARTVISIHAPHAGCDAVSALSGTVRPRFQSTHPMRGATNDVSSIQRSVRISIHAPARGATLTCRCTRRAQSHFQSTHPRGVRDGGYTRVRIRRISFNPRTREGCDGGYTRVRIRRISFNPRTREGCDPQWWNTTDILRPFQSTHPRGVRLTLMLCLRRTSWPFNPRTREGCDFISSES